jgi:hypothetical protein
MTIDLNGNIRLANTYFLGLNHLNKKVINKNLDEFIPVSDKKNFFVILLDPCTENGELISQLQHSNNEFTIVWSFIKMKENLLSHKRNIIVLFRSDISHQIKTEKQLCEAYEDLASLKNKLQAENIQL